MIGYTNKYCKRLPCMILWYSKSLVAFMFLQKYGIYALGRGAAFQQLFYEILKPSVILYCENHNHRIERGISAANPVAKHPQEKESSHLLKFSSGRPLTPLNGSDVEPFLPFNPMVQICTICLVNPRRPVCTFLCDLNFKDGVKV